MKTYSFSFQVKQFGTTDGMLILYSSIEFYGVTYQLIIKFVTEEWDTKFSLLYLLSYTYYTSTLNYQ